MAGVGTFQWVDPNNLASVLWDCNDQAGSGGTLPTGVGSSVMGLQLHAPEFEAERVESPAAPGGITAWFRPGLTVTRWHQGLLNVSGTVTYDNLRDAVRNLNKRLRVGGVIKFVPEGSAQTLYLDAEPSPEIPLFGEALEDLWRALRNRQYPQGIVVEIVRQPYAREADQTIVNAFAIDNGNLAGEFPYTNPGTAPSPAKVTIEVASATADTAQVILGLRAKRDLSADDLTEYRGKYQFVPATPAAFAATWKKIWNKVITPTPATAFVGTFRVFAALKLAGADFYEMLLRTSMTDDDPPGGTNPVRQFDNGSYAAWTNFGEVELGTVTLDGSGAKVQLELWGRSDAAANVTWDQVTLVPADEQLIVASSPGHRHGRFFRLDFPAGVLTLSGGTLSSDSDYVTLDALNDYAETDAVVLPAGTYFAQFLGRVKNQALDRDKIGEIQIFKDAVVDKSSNIYAEKQRLWTGFGAAQPKRVAFEADGVATYKVRVQQTHATEGGVEMRVRKIRRWLVPTVFSSSRFVLDAKTNRGYIANSSGVRKWPLIVEGGMPMLEPGDGVGVVRLGDVATQGALMDADPRGPVAEAIQARAATVTVVVTPWHPL
jgi:hypothetical protein